MSVIGKFLVSGAATLAVGFGLLAVTTPSHAQQGPQGAYCASNDNRFARCQVPWRDAVLVQQASKVRCIRDQTWGFDRNGIWVDKGCRGQFAPAYGRPSYGGPGPGWSRPPQSFQVRCESHGGSRQYCPAELHRDDSVRIVNQLSSADCRQGRSWDWSRDGIWVDRGCRAVFVVDRRY
ncbi:DUF3011 domain-containing protein [Dyella nitratireducens]|uniref:DUF3011 domain-containing protein n=1 Tax=Dyella nitratireducens TaxID=1849580 RepID=A0ABQ1GF68_9GAMM|nr:DUF3011 domain-containing protein [Dyella nitratireducens]GGA42472.1 hypothetical protein GCM10010981_34470 [Dyella nitratireducens]GLQ41996.1 hypothetical protein GCM10007902_18460 [Dyella nitratireducens]